MTDVETYTNSQIDYPYFWEEVVAEYTIDWMIKPIITILSKPDKNIECELYKDLLKDLDEILDLIDETECTLRNLNLDWYLERPYFICEYCKVVCSGNSIEDYHSHICRISRTITIPENYYYIDNFMDIF